MPIRVLITKMPPNVTASIPSRNVASPSSPPIVPGSSVRSSDIHSSCGTDLSPAAPVTTRTATLPTTISTEITASPAISAIVPSSMNESNR